MPELSIILSRRQTYNVVWRSLICQRLVMTSEVADRDSVLPTLRFFVLFYFLFFRTLCEKTAVPIVAKPELKMYAYSLLTKTRQSFTFSCPLLNFRDKTTHFNPLFRNGPSVVGVCAKTGQMFEILKQHYV